MDVWGHGRQQDFFQGWAMRGQKNGSPQQGLGAAPRWWSGGEAQKLTTFSQNDA